MSARPEIPAMTPDDVQVVENVLADTATPAHSRRALLQRATLGVTLGGGVLAALGCGSSKQSGGGGGAAASSSSASASASGSGGDAVQQVLDTAITAEALAVTYLTAVIGMTSKAKSSQAAKLVDVLKAANTAEYDHYKALQSLGAKPLTTKFWAPNDFFGSNLANVFPTLEVAEELFVNAYLIGITEFTKAGKADGARYAAEIAGVEAEHLALARYADGKLPNDYGFMPYKIHDIGSIVGALEGVGVGFGKKGSKPGQFVTFSPPPSSATSGQVTSGSPA